MIDVVRDRGDQTTGLVQLVQEPLDPILFQEHGGRLQNVGRVRRVVVRVLGVVMALDHGQPRVQRPLVAAQRLVHLEVCQQVHAQVHQRSVERQIRGSRLILHPGSYTITPYPSSRTATNYNTTRKCVLRKKNKDVSVLWFFFI